MLSQTEESVRSLSAQEEERSRAAAAAEAIACISKVQPMGKRHNDEFRCCLLNAAATLTRSIG